MMGGRYEVCYLHDPDGVLIKVMNFQAELTHEMEDDWTFDEDGAASRDARMGEGQAVEFAIEARRWCGAAKAKAPNERRETRRNL